MKAATLTLSRPYFAAKCNANFPGNPSLHGLPTIQGLLLLADAERGTTLALMESGEITAGSTRTLQLSWDQSTVKLVAEDQEGCFLTTTVDATGTQTWTITNNTPRDCGS